MIAQARYNPAEEWRSLALRFHCIASMVRIRRLPADFTPDHLADLLKRGSLSSGETGVSRFLLHTWAPDEHPFELSSVTGWDRNHLAALSAWVTGEATGTPLHYFEREDL